MKVKCFAYILLNIFIQHLPAQKQDTVYVKNFAKNNDIEFNTGTYNRSFRFKHFGHDTYLTDHKLQANTSAYVGGTLDYNWVSVSFAVNIPHTAVASKAPAIKALGLGFRKTSSHFQVQAGVERYTGLILPIDRRTRDFDYLDNVNYRAVNANVTYIFNAHKFSMAAATNYSAQQLKSAGSFLLNVSPSWQQFYLSGTLPQNIEATDSAFVTVVAKRPSIITLLPKVGYTYNFVFAKSYWSINPFLWAGAGAQKEPDTSRPFAWASGYTIQLNAGYNSEIFYVYTGISYEKDYGRFIGAQWIKTRFDLTITAGYRIGKLKKKILGIL